NLHFFIASSAALTRIGLPPITLVSFTVPLGATVTSSFTTPARFILRAISGYEGLTLLLTRRSNESCADAVRTEKPANRLVKTIARTSDLHTLRVIFRRDTIPPSK